MQKLIEWKPGYSIAEIQKEIEVSKKRDIPQVTQIEIRDYPNLLCPKKEHCIPEMLDELKKIALKFKLRSKIDFKRLVP